MSTSASYDVVVVGTGIAGLATALALARQRLRVGLLGPRPTLPAATGQFDPRVYALSPASRQLLTELGAWHAMPAERLTTVEAMAIAGDAGGQLDLHAWQAGQSHLADIVEATELERALRNALQVFGVPWHTARFTGMLQQPHATGLRVHTDGTDTLHTTLLVAADGANSPVREAAGLTVHQRTYDAIGLVAHFTSALPHQGVARQWFTPTGILALLPLPDTRDGHQVSMVWSLRRQPATDLLALPQPQQATTLAEQLGSITQQALGSLQLRGGVQGFGLQVQYAPRRVQSQLALLGDAAHVVHPLAGQGLNLGLGDVQALAQVLAEREPWRSPGDERLLRRYQRARAESLAAMRLATDGLYHLFDAPLPPLAWLRNTGMRALNVIPGLKRHLILQASRF